MIRGFVKSQKGVALAEFALVLPFLMLLFLGGVEFTRYIQIHQRLDKTNNQIADIVTKLNAVSISDLDAIIGTVPQLMEPYTATSSSHIVSLVGRVGTDPMIVRDQYRAGGGSGATRIGAPGGAATIPNFTMQPDDEAIVVETYYLYEPLLEDLLRAIGFDLGQEEEGIYKRSIFRPRAGVIGEFN